MIIITTIHPAELSGSQSAPYRPDVLPLSTLCLHKLILTNVDELWSKPGDSDPPSGELWLMSLHHRDMIIQATSNPSDCICQIIWTNPQK